LGFLVRGVLLFKGVFLFKGVDLRLVFRFGAVSACEARPVFAAALARYSNLSQASGSNAVLREAGFLKEGLDMAEEDITQSPEGGILVLVHATR
jgi:hypothetical protein